MALNDYETELFTQIHNNGDAALDTNNGTDMGSVEIPVANYPNQIIIKSGYTILEDAVENQTEHIQVIFDTPFPNACLSVVASPVVNYTCENRMHNTIVTRMTQNGFKVVYKYENTSGQFTSATDDGRLCWIAFGY